MESITVRACTVSDLESAPNITELLAEYGEESAINGLGQPAAQLDLYRAMEQLGTLHLFAAFKGEVLIGLLIMIVSTLPHYGARVASTESFFVAKAHRKFGAGRMLLAHAEAMAKEMGATGFFISSPTGGRLERVAPTIGYRQTNSVFFKVLA